jgi:hypothetical protein
VLGLLRFRLGNHERNASDQAPRPED